MDPGFRRDDSDRVRPFFKAAPIDTIRSAAYARPDGGDDFQRAARARRPRRLPETGAARPSAGAPGRLAAVPGESALAPSPLAARLCLAVAAGGRRDPDLRLSA